MRPPYLFSDLSRSCIVHAPRAWRVRLERNVLEARAAHGTRRESNERDRAERTVVGGGARRGGAVVHRAGFTPVLSCLVLFPDRGRLLTRYSMLWWIQETTTRQGSGVRPLSGQERSGENRQRRTRSATSHDACTRHDVRLVTLDNTVHTCMADRSRSAGRRRSGYHPVKQ